MPVPAHSSCSRSKRCWPERMSLVTLNWNNLSTAERNEALQRTATRSDAAIVAKASAIIATVRRNGDRALNVLTRRYDNCRPEQLRVSQDEIDRAICLLPAPVKQAIDTSIRNVRAFHLAQIPGEISLEIQPGVRCERRNRPIDAVGLYVPSGSAPLPSTAVMLGVPATRRGLPGSCCMHAAASRRERPSRNYLCRTAKRC